ncbi:MAG: hypothetical protein ACPGJV_08525 [Bacteriovoracaceae bacterium]
MKAFLSTCILTSFVLILGQSAFAAPPTPVPALVSHVYAPLGFDSNDNVQVVMEGHLPNACTKNPDSEVFINGNAIEVKATALSYDESNPFCPPMIVPFLEVINLGVLKEGTYKVTINRGSTHEAKTDLIVKQAVSETVDDFLYANIEYIQVIPGTGRVALHGYQPSDCMAFDEVVYIDNGVDTFSILPKMKLISQYCPYKKTPFVAEWEVPQSLIRNKVLLHVRSLKGNSVNFLFER